MEKYWVLSQSGEKYLQGSFFSPPHQEALAEAPKEELCPRPQIRRPRNEGAGPRNVNMGRA